MCRLDLSTTLKWSNEVERRQPCRLCKAIKCCHAPLLHGMESVKCIWPGADLKDQFPGKPERNPSVMPEGLRGQLLQPAAKRAQQGAGYFAASYLRPALLIGNVPPNPCHSPAKGQQLPLGQ